MDTKAVPETTLQDFTERNEYKAAFMECMRYIEGSKSGATLDVNENIGRAFRPLDPSCAALWHRTKRENQERLRASFNYYLTDFNESEIQAMQDMGLIGDGYEVDNS